MYEEYYNKKLYPFQNKNLELINSCGTNFYLTDGTVLCRYLLNHRYSDDLDFFVNNDKNYKKDVEKIINVLRENYKDRLNLGVIDSAFARIFIEENNVTLKIEFINDVPFHDGGFDGNLFYSKIDNWRNILSNKISALSRNEAKDIADIIFLAGKFSFNWEKMIENAKKKDLWVNEIDVSACFDNFDPNRFENIKWIEKPDIKRIGGELKTAAKDILLGSDNSLNP